MDQVCLKCCVLEGIALLDNNNNNNKNNSENFAELVELAELRSDRGLGEQ